MKTDAFLFPLRGKLRKLAVYGALGLGLLYGLGVLAGFAWLHYVRKNDEISLGDLALFRWQSVRRDMAAQKFAKAKVEWEAQKYQAAYLSYSSAVRKDPDNIPGRLSAAAFLRAVGATNMGIAMLEEGLARAPDDRRLIEQTFELLIASGRDRHALDLLHGRYASKLSDPDGLPLQTYEIQATLNAEGAAAAQRLLERHVELQKYPPATPVVSRVLWESQQRLKAIDLLGKFVQTPSGDFASHALLARWQEAGGTPADGVRTAERACARFPQEMAPRVLLIEMLAADSSGPSRWQSAIGSYLRDFSGRPESITLLAELAGRKGWADLARTLYQVGACQQPDLSLLALYYGDALARNSRLVELRQLLEQLETQAPEGNAAFMVQLRQRQVMAAAALGDQGNVREFARRLTTTLRTDPDALEACRRRFLQLGITEAVAELSGRTGPTRVTARQ